MLLIHVMIVLLTSFSAVASCMSFRNTLFYTRLNPTSPEFLAGSFTTAASHDCCVVRRPTGVRSPAAQVVIVLRGDVA